MGLHNPSGLDAGSEDVLLSRDVVSLAQSIQGIQVAEREEGERERESRRSEESCLCQRLCAYITFEKVIKLGKVARKTFLPCHQSERKAMCLLLPCYSVKSVSCIPRSVFILPKQSLEEATVWTVLLHACGTVHISGSSAIPQFLQR